MLFINDQSTGTPLRIYVCYC